MRASSHPTQSDRKGVRYQCCTQHCELRAHLQDREPVSVSPHTHTQSGRKGVQYQCVALSTQSSELTSTRVSQPEWVCASGLCWTSHPGDSGQWPLCPVCPSPCLWLEWHPLTELRQPGVPWLLTDVPWLQAYNRVLISFAFDAE